MRLSRRCREFGRFVVALATKISLAVALWALYFIVDAPFSTGMKIAVFAPKTSAIGELAEPRTKFIARP